MTSPQTRRLSAALLALATLLPACNKSREAETADEPDAKPARANPPHGGKPTDPDAPFPGAPDQAAPKAAPAWGGGPNIPFDSNAAVTFGPAGCPVAVVGSDVWDLKTFKSIRQLSEPYDRQGLRALTPDGRYFAAADKSPNQTETTVFVWDTNTGKRVLQVPPVKEAFVDLLTFYQSSHLLVGGRHNQSVDVWDVKGGKVVGRLTVPDRRVEPDKLAFTPDGNYFACIAHDKVVVTETSSNKQVAVMAPPGAAPGQPKRAAGSDAVFVYAWSRGFAFSPDGSELALFSTHPAPRLIVWNAKGELVTDLPVPMPQFVGHRNTLEWMPDGSGWLLNGSLVDRKAGRAVLSMKIPFASDVMPHLLDRERVIGVFGEDRTRLQVVTVPWAKLNAAVKQMTGKADAYLAPGQPVSIELELAGLRGDEAETRRVLTEALTQRLTRDGIPVAAGRPTVLRLRLLEEAGEALPIVERQSPFDRRGRDTGRKATEAKGAAVLEVVAKGEAQPLWRGHLTASSSRSFSEEINDATVRKSMLEHLTRQLNTLDMPYFLPKSKDVVALPAVFE